MAEYESFVNKPCYASDFRRLSTELIDAIKTRGITFIPVTEKILMEASDINSMRNAAYDTLNYSSFLSEITSGMQIKHEQLECISQAISDVNNLLRCRSGCTGNCHSSCTKECTSSCLGSEHHNGSCSYATWFCSGNCNNHCGAGCSGSCEGTCGQGCSNYCVSSCKNSSISSANRLPGTMVSV